MKVGREDTFRKLMGRSSHMWWGSGKTFRPPGGKNSAWIPFTLAGAKPNPSDKFVVNLYGRYCNANKFAGEIDLLEVLDAMKRQYPIDENRIVETGFSMG